MTKQITRTLSRARSTWRWSEILRAVAVWLAPSLAALLLLFVLDNLLHLPGGLRLVFGLLWIAGAGAAFVLYVLPRLARRRTYQATARMLEERLAISGNVFINALQLTREARSNGGIPEAALGEITDKADKAAGHVDVARLWRLKPLVRALRVVGIAVGVVLLYAVLFPDYASNAVARFRDPLGEVMPVTDVVLEVAPGNVRVVAGASVEVRAAVRVRHGELPSVASLSVRGNGEPWEVATMTLAATRGKERLFVASVGPVEAELEYRVVSGDAHSRTYRISVVKPPAVTASKLLLEPPAYAGLEASVIADPVVVRALSGTKAALSFELDRTPVVLTLHLPGGAEVRSEVAAGETKAAFAFGIVDPGTIRLTLEDTSGTGAGAPGGPGTVVDAWSAPVTVIDDAAPRLSLSADAPSQILPPGVDLPLTAKAEDDYGLAGLRFVVERVSTKTSTDLKTWRYPAPGERRVNERLVVPLDPLAFVPGETYRFLAEAGDHHPSGEHVVRSRSVVVRIARVRELRIDADHALATPFEKLRRLAERQRAAVAQSAGLIELFAEHEQKGRFRARARETASNQGAIHADVVPLAKEFAQIRGGATTADRLLRLDTGLFVRIDAALGPAAASGAKQRVREALGVALPLQREALASLEALLGKLALDIATKEVAASSDDDESGRSLAEELREKAEMLREFLDEQRRLIELSRELEEKNPEDWTEEDEQLLGRLEAQELKWAQFLEEAFTDLSKVPDQDFANSDLIEEFNEVYMEVKKAAEALSARKIEIAVPLEQAGLELAEKLEHNLERWIPDTPDYQKWVMEEPEGDFDVPLADLPDELEDIVGDLIDEAEDMDESVEDVSSSWMDSLDHGAGWDATDGPISNMSARGITGNRLPNQNEIGGRSGEGRSGKSHGQFVERTAEGKGGRETPTRLTEDPFESGSVDDRSNEATGGSTGGGKLAGQGMEGLRGRVPPPTLRKLDRLANHQGELRQRAERLARVLRKLHLPAGDVEDAARLLAWSENHLKNGVGFDLRVAHTSLKQALAHARSSLDYEADTLRERGANLPPRVRDELMEGLTRSVPTGYEDVLRAYYRAIAEGR